DVNKMSSDNNYYLQIVQGEIEEDEEVLILSENEEIGEIEEISLYGRATEIDDMIQNNATNGNAGKNITMYPTPATILTTNSSNDPNNANSANKKIIIRRKTTKSNKPYNVKHHTHNSLIQ